MRKIYTITKKKKTVSIEMPSDHYEHLCLEAKKIIETFCKDEKVSLEDIANALPVLFVIMPTQEVLKDLNIGDKIHI